MAEDWRSEAFRRKVIAQIDEAVRMAATPMTKSSMEMENHVFLKAKTREEYLALVARLILHVKGINAQKEKEKKGMGPGGMMYSQQQGMPQGGATGLQQQPMQDPINALQNLAMQGTTVSGQQTGILTPQQQAQMQQQQQQQHRQQLMQQHMLLQQQQQQQQQQQRNMANMQQQRPPLQRQDAFIVTSADKVQIQPVAQQLPASANPQQQQQQQQQQSQYQHQNMPVGQQRPGPQGVPMSQPGNFPQGNIGQQAQPQQMMSQASTVSSAVPSPIQQSTGSQMTHSPISMMTSPSPQGYVVPSPASRNFSALSPSSTNLNTPAAGSGQAPISQEDQAYLDKLNQLSKYIEPLRRINRRMMNRQSADKDEDRVREIHKMKNLLEILTDPSKRLPWKTLLKCEQVLLKLELEWDKTGELAPSADTVVTKATTTATHMCQPLLDAVAAHMASPMLNHSLQRTFGPAVTALHGSPIRAPSPPPKRRRVEEQEHDEIPHILQGEIARLGNRFKVNFDPTQHGGSKDIHLLCRLDDKNLPSIPPISVKVPGTYPNNSPECDTTATEYESNIFLQSVQNTLEVLLLRMPDKFTFTELLDKWEMSVRKACAASV